MIDMLESTSQCAVDLSISAADVAHSIWLMVRHIFPTAAPHPHLSFVPTVSKLALFAFLTAHRQVDEGVLTLINGWIVAAANVPFIEHASIPISSISAIAPPYLPLPALDIFRFRLGSALDRFESVVCVTL